MARTPKNQADTPDAAEEPSFQDTETSDETHDGTGQPQAAADADAAPAGADARDPLDAPLGDTDGTATPEQPAAARATRAASNLSPTAPEPPTRAVVGAPDLSDMDPRFGKAHDLAERGLSFASVNDLAKAVLLMLDMQRSPDAGGSDIAQALARGEEPTLL